MEKCNIEAEKSNHSLLKTIFISRVRNLCNLDMDIDTAYKKKNKHWNVMVTLYDLDLTN